MDQSSPALEVNVGRQGRLVIPAALREQDRLILEKPDAIKQRLRERFAKVPADRQLVDELLAERRLEAQQEGE